MSNEQRFQEVYSEGFANSKQILVDLKTGVNYLFCRGGYAGGLTPLLDEKGNVVITKNV